MTRSPLRQSAYSRNPGGPGRTGLRLVSRGFHLPHREEGIVGSSQEIRKALRARTRRGTGCSRSAGEVAVPNG